MIVYKYITLEFKCSKSREEVPGTQWIEDLDALTSVNISVDVAESGSIHINVQTNVSDTVLEEINKKRLSKMEYPTTTNTLDHIVFPLAKGTQSFYYNGLYPCKFDPDGPKYVVWVQYQKVNEVCDVLMQIIFKKKSGVIGFISETYLTKRIGENGFMVEVFVDGGEDSE
jgi:hypothetical protein